MEKNKLDIEKSLNNFYIKRANFMKRFELSMNNCCRCVKPCSIVENKCK